MEESIALFLVGMVIIYTNINPSLSYVCFTIYFYKKTHGISRGRKYLKGFSIILSNYIDINFKARCTHMNTLECQYKDMIDGYVDRGHFTKKEAEEIFSSIGELSGSLCFDIFMINLMQKRAALTENTIHDLELMWYVNMVSFYGQTKVTSYDILKLLLGDLISKYGDNSLLIYMLDLNNGLEVSLEEVTNTLSESQFGEINFWGKHLKALWNKWQVLSQEVTQCFQ